MARLTTARAWRRAAPVAAVVFSAMSAAAQTPKTLGDFLAITERAAAKVSLAASNSAASRALDSLIGVVRGGDADQLTFAQLADIAQKRVPSMLTIARWRKERLQEWPTIVDAVTGIREIINVAIAPGRAGDPDVAAAVEASNEIGTAIRFAASANAAEQLRAFEIKFGPESPRLNAAEVIVNYFGQLVLPCSRIWPLPCFGVRSDGFPSPYEIVGAYRSTSFTMSDEGSDKNLPRMVSAGQAGLRIYRFGKGWGDGSPLARLIRPSNATIGLLALGYRDAPLVSPLARDARLGVFAAWGDLQAGFVGGSRSRVVMGIGKQIIPYLF